WSTRPLRSGGLLGDPRGLAAAASRGSVARSADGTTTTGSALPVAGLRSERQEVTWLWELAPEGTGRWEVDAHGGDCRLVLSGSAPAGPPPEPLAPGAS
ncbi:hypothetical protein DZG02_17575, partial [Clavibacter lycopersici]